ncbi:hypothetical protein DH2020_000969 [Rehmannia glutinosa]|uniref:Myb/SANT-like domain-containing protein n=1 Tax=Rehmannia glutinosa TaxID=99300 RepID=A0ABR0XYQ1_REHGL
MSWSRREEEALVAALKEVIANGWKSENSFKIGYLQALEQEMQKIILGTDLKGIPHINSKIHVWKKDYGSLVTMLSHSGIGWNVTTNMIEVPDDAWAEYVKVDANARLMRNKSWPFYNDWVMIFGKDRATGEHAEDFTDALNHVLNGQSIPQVDYHVNLVNCRIITFCQSTDARLGDIAKRIGYEYDISFARKEVFGVVENMQRLSPRDKPASVLESLLVKNTEDLELFFILPDGP